MNPVIWKTRKKGSIAIKKTNNSHVLNIYERNKHQRFYRYKPC